MPFADIGSSPLTPGLSPARIHYREEGSGFPLIFLHGGWGYEIYPFDRQIGAFNKQLRIIIPDRSGYGRSTKIKILPTDFHKLAAMEMISFLDALSIQHALIWGHSDGAVIAAVMALSAPERITGLILEAFHYFKVKPGSERFFSSLAQDPDRLGERITHRLKLEHGEEHWRNVIKMNSEAWLKIAAESRGPSEDLFGGQLQKLSVPAVFIHGAQDPRTEPGEIETVSQVLRKTTIHLIKGARHSPHSEKGSAHQTTLLAKQFLQQFLSSYKGNPGGRLRPIISSACK